MFDAMPWRTSLDPAEFCVRSGWPSLPFCSTVAGKKLPGEIDSLISDAKENDVLRIISPVLDDAEVVEAICAAQQRGALVKILTSLFDNRGRIITMGWDEARPVQDAHQEAIRRLARNGVLLRSPRTTPHGKIVILGGARFYFGSANLARNSLRGSAVEAGIVLSDTILLEWMESAFEGIWKSCPFSMRNRAGAISLIERMKNPGSAQSPRKCEWASKDGWKLMVSEPGGKPTLAGSLAELVRGAQEEVILAALSFYQLDKISVLGEAIGECLRRNVRVRAVVRPEHFKPEEYPDDSTLKLIREGLELTGVTGLHAKGCLVDQRMCGIISANFNPYSLEPKVESSNVELGLFGRAESERLKGFATFLRELVDHPTHRFVT